MCAHSDGRNFAVICAAFTFLCGIYLVGASIQLFWRVQSIRSIRAIYRAMLDRSTQFRPLLSSVVWKNVCIFYCAL